jgi:hypothetical protein
MEALKASLAAAQPKDKTQEPIPIASRKPPKASPRKTAGEVAAAEPKKKSSKR